MKWFVYIVQGKVGSLYTGITTNLERRIAEHNTSSVRGAKSLRGKRPVRLAYSERFYKETRARKREAAIKNWERKDKLELINKRKSAGLTK